MLYDIGYDVRNDVIIWFYISKAWWTIWYIMKYDIWFDLCYELHYDIWYDHNTEQNDHTDPGDSAIETWYGYGYECEY